MAVLVRLVLLVLRGHVVDRDLGLLVVVVGLRLRVLLVEQEVRLDEGRVDRDDKSLRAFEFLEERVRVRR